MKLLILSLVAMIGLSACSRESSGPERYPNTELTKTCEFAGTWSRCDTYEGSSNRVILVANGLRISESIDNYSSNASCEGAPDSSFSFTAGYALGAYGGSAFLSGGTDVEMSDISLDLFGCGAAPAYTVIKLNEDCTEFVPTTSPPSCNGADRGTDFDTKPFVRQPE